MKQHQAMSAVQKHKILWRKKSQCASSFAIFFLLSNYSEQLKICGNNEFRSPLNSAEANNRVHHRLVPKEV